MKNDLIPLDQLQQNNPAQREVLKTSHAKHPFDTMYQTDVWHDWF